MPTGLKANGQCESVGIGHLLYITDTRTNRFFRCDLQEHPMRGLYLQAGRMLDDDNHRSALKLRKTSITMMFKECISLEPAYDTCAIIVWSNAKFSYIVKMW